MNKIEYRELTVDNFSVYSLDNFKRYQSVTKCWRKVGNIYKLLPVTYVEDWSLSECRELSERIIDALKAGSLAFGAVCDNEIIGFALIDGKRFGSKNQYVDLAEFYVSEQFRRKGIGRKLFNLACNAAERLGGAKLYISAHSAEESIAAYKSYGCIFAKEINRALAEKEPCDLQLEYVLNENI